MSIDLEWAKLDSSLSSTLVDVLNRQLATTPRPSFIGPVQVTSLDFGSASPDVELVDLRDIYRDFLEDDDDDSLSDREPVKVTEGGADDDDDGFEWVSRKAAGRSVAEELSQSMPYRHSMNYGRGPSADMFASTPTLHSPRDIWNGGMSMPGLGDFRPSYAPGPSSFYRSSPLSPQGPPSPPEPEPAEPEPADEATPPPPPNQHPNLQLHLHITWQSDLRITLTTSLLINYPSPMFMSLPIKLSVTGLLFTGELAVAYEGERRRVHLCILDDQDPYGPAGDRPKRRDSLPPDLDDEAAGRPAKPLPIGQRLLPNIYIESEIGQADKHVLKNVTRVERFIQDVIRKTVEEELVFPNFHTLVMGEQ